MVIIEMNPRVSRSSALASRRARAIASAIVQRWAGLSIVTDTISRLPWNFSACSAIVEISRGLSIISPCICSSRRLVLESDNHQFFISLYADSPAKTMLCLRPVTRNIPEGEK